MTIEDVVREHTYAEGNRVALSQTDLSEIIFIYQVLAMKIGSEMHRIVDKKVAIANAA